MTEFGVINLMDIHTGTRVGDDMNATMPCGSALMALYAGNGTPQLTPAEATKNPAGGWDLTIRSPKADKTIKALAKSEMMSLFTTGYTMAVGMNSASRARWRSFLERCQITD